MQPTRVAHERWFPTNFTQARSRLAGASALSLALSLTLLGAGAGAGAAQANTLSTAVSSGARATVPMTVSAMGSADPAATLRVYVQQGAPGCASGNSGPENAQAQSTRAGSTEVIAQQPSGAFSYSAAFTPPASGQYFLCAYLFGSSTNQGSSQSSASFNVGPAPPAGTNPPAAPGPAGTAPRPKRCVVPTLKGRTYGGARKLIRRAGCNVGTVFRPDLRTSRIARARGRVLRVVSQSPRPRSVRKAGGRVTLRLGYVKAPRRSSGR